MKQRTSCACVMETIGGPAPPTTAVIVQSSIGVASTSSELAVMDTRASGPNPADVAAATARSAMTAYLKAAAWKRILTELCDSGLIDSLAGATRLKQFWVVLNELQDLPLLQVRL